MLGALHRRFGNVDYNNISSIKDSYFNRLLKEQFLKQKLGNSEIHQKLNRKINFHLIWSYSHDKIKKILLILEVVLNIIIVQLS